MLTSLIAVGWCYFLYRDTTNMGCDRPCYLTHLPGERAQCRNVSSEDRDANFDCRPLRDVDSAVEEVGRLEVFDVWHAYQGSVARNASYAQQRRNQNFCFTFDIEPPQQRSQKYTEADICSCGDRTVEICHADDDFHADALPISGALHPCPEEMDRCALKQGKEEVGNTDHDGSCGDGYRGDAVQPDDRCQAKKEEAQGNFGERDGRCVGKKAEPPASHGMD